MVFVVKPMQVVGLPIVNCSDEFPVRRVYCVGRNYADHAREMGSDPEREPPFFFCKPNDAESIVPVAEGQEVVVPYPSVTQNYHHEVELVVALGQGGRNLSPEDAMACVYGYAVGLDMTRRDVQNQMKQTGRPWEIGKAFDYSAPIGAISPLATVPDLEQASIVLTVNGVERQRSNIGQLIWNVAETIAKLSEWFELKAGDVIFTGTPEGVAAVVAGDELHAHIDGLSDVRVRIAPRLSA